jgi:hypothetical protein
VAPKIKLSARGRDEQRNSLGAWQSAEILGAPALGKAGQTPRIFACPLVLGREREFADRHAEWGVQIHVGHVEFGPARFGEGSINQSPLGTCRTTAKLFLGKGAKPGATCAILS